MILHDGAITLKPLRYRDRKRWDEVRRANREWLSPWEATRPLIPGESSGGSLPTYYEMVNQHRREGRQLRSISLGIWFSEGGKSNFVGQITLGGIVLGALRGAHIGYWIDSRYSNRGITTQSVNLLTRYAFDELALHRIEINLRPENSASKKVAEKCGYTFEGLRPRFLHIDGQWRDHLSFYKENPAIQ
jgi:ribosomal-protein-alanine N-acetyltransferase